MVGSHNFELTFLVLKNQVHFEPQQKKEGEKWKHYLRGVFFFFFFFFFPWRVSTSHFPLKFPRNLIDSFQNLLGGGTPEGYKTCPRTKT